MIGAWMKTRHSLLLFWGRIAVYSLLLSGLWQTTSALGQDSSGGELKIEGTYITQLVLNGDDHHTEHLNAPHGNVSLPLDTYRIRAIELQGGYTCLPQSFASLGRITVTRDKPTVLKVGGPLQQVVKVERQGRVLVLNYELVGIGNEKYANTRRDNKPSFTIYEGQKAIASGQFEYG
jgi:hypothetical protein